MDLIISPRESTDPVRSEERHLHLVPEPTELDGDADEDREAGQGEETTGLGLASVTYLPTVIPGEEEHAREGEDDLVVQVAAVLPLPKV
jgi:hypothetical protein